MLVLLVSCLSHLTPRHSIYIAGSLMYSGLAVALHPLTVVKIRRQVAADGNPTTTTNTISQSSSSGLQSIRQYYRGLSVVLSLAVPARIIYVSVLECSRELIDHNARHLLLNPPSSLKPYGEELIGLLPLVAPLSGGIAGGLAAVSSQLAVVPMDVISQKLMVMDDSMYQQRGSAINVTKSIIANEGWQGLFKGFGLSLFTSLPAGTIWWATYAGCKDQLSIYGDPSNDRCLESTSVGSIPLGVRQGCIQILSAFNAAFVSAVLTQPLDTIKTRLQVGSSNSAGIPSNEGIVSIAKELASTSKLYHGLLPRIVHMGIWGSVLSSAYEYLKVVSRKDYNP